MKLCSEECLSICDFCKFYRFNADENGVYIGDGMCVFWNRAHHPSDSCKEFECINFKTLEE